jgi:NAD(P)-dependent dehydrogenase (short-subunit alcohol dehydrogenase family)
MYTDLKGKTALITGAGKKSGIGFAIAEKMAACGANILIADLGGAGKKDLIGDAEDQVRTANLHEMEELAQELSASFGIDCKSMHIDVTDASSIARMAETVSDACGAIHILVNNAGASFGVPADVASYDEAAWMKTIDVNLHGVFRVSRAVLPMLREAGRGVIINIASRAGKVPPLFNGAYAVAKAGVIMLTKVMAKELAGSGIRVNAICPGQIMTDIEKWRFGLEAKFLGTTPEEQEAAMCRTIPLARIGEPGEVAELAAFLASDASAYITGQAVNITGGQLMEL